MKRFAFVKDDGFVAFVSNPGVDDNYVEGNEFYGYICREIPDVADPVDVVQNWYWKDGWKQRQVQPTQFHAWDAATESWVGNVELAKIDKKAQVNYMRQNKDNEPISYLGSLFDCGYDSKINLQSVCSALSSGYVLPEGYNWRDNANVLHNADHEFLFGLLEAIVSRTNELYNASWNHKQAIDLIEDFNELQSYDISLNW